MALIRENGTLLGQLSTIAVVTFGALRVIDGAMTIGGLAACTLLAGRSINPAMSAFVYLNRLSDRKEAEGKIDGVLSLPEAPLWTCKGTQPFDCNSIELSVDAIEGGRAAAQQLLTAVVVDADQPAEAAADQSSLHEAAADFLPDDPDPVSHGVSGA